ncbi:hypothetical protein Moror_9746 [Moniliophthora roreri MCA 2997]|uniref:G-protein coupled receptors family 2 profile 2 domain-containing protein n=2 Tax=Moniliophthora roreri TaxID=221103 RepID=V2WYF9_MONRO|nr:hypothetical protein Moror_9746 [Moniliophthora roreri MCA 2997]KAI3613731.1 hypothetical protein WG66_013510 [Moniliophthora roreri]
MAPLPASPIPPARSVAVFIPLSNKELPGAIAVNVFAILSSIALLSIILRGIWLVGLRLCGRNISQYRDYIFFNTQLGYYAACLLIANSFNSVAGLMGLPFLIQRGITEDGYCIAQAVVMQFGNVATAYFTVAIGIHTFNSLVLRKRQSVFIYAPAIFLGWSLATVIAVLPIMVNVGPIYGVSGLACGVKTTFGSSLFFLHLLPIFVAALLSGILYSLIFLVLRGSLVIKGGVKLSLDRNDRGDTSGEKYQRFVAGIAKSMIWYPAAYILFLIPYSVVRLLGLAGMEVPFEVAVFAFVCWFTLGVANALLLYNTHRVLTPAFGAGGPTQFKQSKRDTDMSFGSADTLKRLTTVSATPIHYNLTEKMINEYRAGNPSISPTTDTSSERRLLVGDNRSLYSHNSPDVAGIPRNISPVAELNEGLNAHPDVVGTKIYPMSEHVRKESTDTLSSLPPPPRRIRSPPVALQFSNAYRSSTNIDQRSSSSFRTQSPVSMTSMTNPPRMTALPQRTSSVYSAGSIELDLSGWLSRQNADGSMPSAIRNQPMLSAVQPSFPSPVADPSAPPSARLRPLLLASVERTGSPTLAQHYNRLYSNNPTTSPQ